MSSRTYLGYIFGYTNGGRTHINLRLNASPLARKHLHHTQVQYTVSPEGEDSDSKWSQ